MTETKDWQRARRPEQKEERSAAILNAAAALLDARGINGTSLNAIARAVGLSKANLYRYFESREAMLLELMLREQAAWADELSELLEPLAGKDDLDGVADITVSTLAERSRLCVLVAALGGVLEHNVSLEAVIDFKRKCLGLTQEVAAPIAAALPIGVEQASQLITMTIITASGAWPLCHPSEVAVQALELPELAPLKLDFEETVKTQFRALLNQLICETGGKSAKPKQ